MSSTHMATRSMPMVVKRPAAWATRALVPTPSVEDTRIGSRYRLGSKANSPPKPPMSPTTSGRNVERTRSLMRATASSPAVMLTPAASYVSPTDWRVSRVRALQGLDLSVLRDGHVDRVLAGEARRAEPRPRRTGRRDQAVEIEVGERVAAQVLADLADGHARRQQLRARAEVHPEEARPGDGRKADAEVDLRGAGLAQHADEGALRGAAD